MTLNPWSKARRLEDSLKAAEAERDRLKHEVEVANQEKKVAEINLQIAESQRDLDWHLRRGRIGF